MVTNPYLRRIVKESGRREITTSMIVEAEKVEWEAGLGAYTGMLKALSGAPQNMALLQQQSMGMAAAQSGQYLGTGLMSQLGVGAALSSLFTARCPYCGK